jgi:hypothetical protein
MSAHPDEILHRFRYHPATEVTGPAHDETRAGYLGLAEYVIDHIPPGRHQSLALTALQESMMWCNAAIACDTKPARAEQR